jgi:L-ascorbate metabolism protein UlaG (beta-lactamase superfamily)
MNRRTFLQDAAALSGVVAMPFGAWAKKSPMKIHFLRHATFLLEADGVTLLIDPMLSPKDGMDPVANASTTDRIPMVDLPIDEASLKELLTKVDAVIVTHTHRDHWDARAKELLAKDISLLCQPSDKDALTAAGFTNLLPVEDTIEFKGLRIDRTGGQHGTGDIGEKMGKVSGFVIEQNGQRLYIAGDTIWCDPVADALKKHTPDFIIVNAGAAQFLQGGPITMTSDDVVTVCRALPSAKVIAVHMDTVNHCLLKRTDLKKILQQHNLTPRCTLPTDGQVLPLL